MKAKQTTVRELTNSAEFRAGKSIRFREGRLTYEISAGGTQRGVIMRRNTQPRGSAGSWSPWHFGVISIEDLDAPGRITTKSRAW